MLDVSLYRLYHSWICAIHPPFTGAPKILGRFLDQAGRSENILKTTLRLEKNPLELAFLGGFGLEDSDFVCGLVSEFAQRLPQHVSYTSTD